MPGLFKKIEKEENLLYKHLQEEILFLRSQNQELLEKLALACKLFIPHLERQTPKQYDPKIKDYREMTPEEIERDRQGLQELGII